MKVIEGSSSTPLKIDITVEHVGEQRCALLYEPEIESPDVEMVSFIPKTISPPWLRHEDEEQGD